MYTNGIRSDEKILELSNPVNCQTVRVLLLCLGMLDSSKNILENYAFKGIKQ